jgi:hypothetical protein
MLARGALDPRREAIVPPGAPSAPTVRQGRFRPASAKRLGPDHVRVTIPPGSAGWLVLANAYSRTWKATVGGRDVKPQPTDFAAMGVPVRPGTHRVDFRLDRSGFWAGAWITLAALALTLLLAAWRPLRGLTPPGAHRRRFGRRGSATSERVAP